MMIDDQGKLWVFGANYYGQLGLGDTQKRNQPVKHGHLTNIQQLSSGYGGYFSLVKHENRSIFAMGSNNYGQLGIGNLSEREIYPSLLCEEYSYVWNHQTKHKHIKNAQFIIEEQQANCYEIVDVHSNEKDHTSSLVKRELSDLEFVNEIDAKRKLTVDNHQ